MPRDEELGAQTPADGPAPTRIAALDLIRGVAVLGILAVNVAGFSGPRAATDSTALGYGALAAPPPWWDESAYAFVFLVFEGKMRALFSLLFGASLLLFIDRAEAAGRDGGRLQARRLGWLMLFGWLHYVLFWWGDILFVYALAGFIVLPLRRLPGRAQVALALIVFAAWHGGQAWGGWPVDRAEMAVHDGTATPAEARSAAQALRETRAWMATDVARDGEGFVVQAADKVRNAPLWPLVMATYTLGETVPLMLIGMALMRSGFFAGGWPARSLRRLALVGIGGGGAMTLALLGWAWPRHFPPLAMADILGYWAAPAHLLMALGLAALLVRATPWLLGRATGKRLAAAGRMAFSNYLGCTVVMTALCYRWGLGLYGEVGRAAQLLFVLGGWMLMLAWSAPWLARFRQGPLEWLWRSLTEGRRLPLRRGRG